MKERFFRNRTAVFTVVFVLLVGLVGILAPVIAPNDPYETNILNKFASYSLQYPLGTDQLGRCVLSRMIYGIRPTLGLALLTMFGTISLGAILGIMAGYFRGIVEEVIMRVVDVMLSFPSQIMVFAVVALLGVSVQNVIIANVFIKWAWYARMIRTGVMQYRSHDLNAISRVADRIVVLNHGAVMDRGDFRHILHHAQDPYTKLLVEKRADVMRRYTAVLNGKKEAAHA